MSEDPKNLPARPDKTIDWLNKSRDNWKNKTLATKNELKCAKRAQKRARQSRQEWKKEYHLLKQEQTIAITKKNEEILNLQTKVSELEQENMDLKKKYLLRLMTKK